LFATGEVYNRTMVKLLDPEFNLVTACCRPTGQAGRVDAIIAAAREPFDAGRLLVLAHAHRVEALVEDGLRRAGVALPEAAAGLLSRRASIARLQMMRIAGEEVRLAELLRDEGIEAVFVKGATLAMLAHGSLANKASWDIDLLVNHARIDDAIEVLRDAGYEFDHPAFKADMARSFAKRSRESAWTNLARGTTVELHWALVDNPLLLPGIGIGSARQNVKLAGSRMVPTLTTPDLFAFLAVHGMGHGWSRLKWLADIASLLDDRFDALPELFIHARSVNAGRCAAVALLLMRDLLGVAIPSQLVTEISGDRQAVRLADFSLRTMRALARVDGRPDHRLSHWWELHTAQMKMAPGFRNGLADIWAKLNNPLVPRRLLLPRWLLVPDALLIWIPTALARRIAAKLQSVRLGNVANSA
jgi:Uncharacterised nucleotidyltransferase